MVINRYIYSLFSVLYFSFIFSADKVARPTNIEQIICDEARKNTPPELAACTTLKCVEDLLYAEERKALSEVFKEHHSWHTHDSFSNAVQWSRWWNTQWRNLSSWMTRHDKKALGADIVETTKNMLAKQNVDAQGIDIIEDDAGCTNEIDASMRFHAYATANKIAFSKHALSAMDSGYVNYIIAHETIHVKEDHYLKRMCLYSDLVPADREGIVNFLKLESIQKSNSAMQLLRAQEKQATLFPLTRLEDADVSNGAYKATVLPCIFDYLKGDLKSKWNKSSPAVTHPECSELLPYILKIEDLKKKGAVPLYEKAHNRAAQF